MSKTQGKENLIKPKTSYNSLNKSGNQGRALETENSYNISSWLYSLTWPQICTSCQGNLA